LAFKGKQDTFDLPAIKYLAKKLNIPLNLKLIEEKGIKDKTVSATLKEKLLFYIWGVLNSENDFPNKSGVKKGYSKCFKFYVGKGNNSQLVKAILNQRFWWQAHTKEDLNEINFLWTEWRCNQELNKLPSKITKPVKSELYQSDSADNSDNEENEEVRILPSSKYMMLMTPEQNLPHDSKKLYNRLEENNNLTSKKLLFLNMKLYYESLGCNPFDYLPMTFHIKKGEKDEEFLKFKQHFLEQEQKVESGEELSNVWIIKPGEMSNRGCGISVSDDIDDVKMILNDLAVKSHRTSIVQKYIDRPLLINKRKFDIRIFTMITCYNEGYMKGYYYNEGYLRTS
jgi:tubulin---tyrosine ligase